MKRLETQEWRSMRPGSDPEYLVDCFTDLADLLNISEPHRNIFRSELQKQGSMPNVVRIARLHPNL